MRFSYEDLNPVSTPKLGCNGNGMDLPASGREYTFITNLSSDTLKFDSYDSEDFMLSKNVLDPNESRYIQTGWDAAESLHSRMIELDVGGECLERYVEVSGGVW